MTIEFKCKDKTYKLLEPTNKALLEAEEHRIKSLSVALSNNMFPARLLYDKARDMGLWDDDKAKEVANKQKELNDLVEKLDAGGYDVDQAIKDAHKINDLRNDIYKLNAPANSLMEYCADRYAEMAEEDYLVYSTLCNQNNKPVYSTFDAFLVDKKKNSELLYHAYMARTKADLSFLQELPENKFLDEYDESFVMPGTKEEEEKPKVEKKPFTRKGKPITKE